MFTEITADNSCNHCSSSYTVNIGTFSFISQPRSDSLVRWVVFSSIRLCGVCVCMVCLSVCSFVVDAITFEPFQIIP